MTSRWRTAVPLALLMTISMTRISGQAAPRVQPPTAQSTSAASAASAELDATIARAMTLVFDREFDAARPLFEQVRDAATARGLDAARAWALVGLGHVALGTKNANDVQATKEPDGTDRAAALGRQALALFETLGDTRGIGRASYLLSLTDTKRDRASALAHAERALQAASAANDLAGRARATLRLDDVDSAPAATMLPMLLGASEDAHRVGETRLEAYARHRAGDIQFTLGQFVQARESLTQAATLYQQVGPSANMALGTVYNSFGRLYRTHGRTREALRLQLAALALHESSGDSVFHLQSLNAVAATYQMVDEFGKAREFYLRALAMAERSSTPQTQNFLRANLTSVLMDERRWPEALETLQKVIAAGPGTYASLRYRQLTDTYIKLGRPADALAAADKSVAACSDFVSSLCSNALTGRAKAHELAGDHVAALRDVDAALAGLDGMRARLVPADYFKQNFHTEYAQTYSVAIALQANAGQPRRALEIAEQARARAFLDLLASRPNAREGATNPASVGASGSTPVATTGGASMGTPASADDLIAAAARLRSTLLIYWVAKDELFIWVVTPAGRIDIRRVPVRLAALRELVRNTAPFEADEADAIGAAPALTLGPGLALIEPERPANDRPAAAPALAPENMAASNGATAVLAAPETTEDGNGGGRKESEARAPLLVTRGSAERVTMPAARPDGWRELYDLLIRPVRDLLPCDPDSLLTIVPHGPLLPLSFAALQNERGRYLLEDYTLHYAPAGAILGFTAARRRADARAGSMLIVADPALPPPADLERPLPRLPGARREADAITRLIPASKRPTPSVKTTTPGTDARARIAVLRDTGATEAATRTLANDRAVLHFATHAIVRGDAPFQSYLALSPSSPDATSTTQLASDGRLTAEEIYDLDLHTDLVMLSACRSAAGTVGGDGVSTFARAFVYAGAASLIGSVWDVADEPTGQLVRDFYRGWLSGASKSRALRNAQLTLLRDLRAGRITVNTTLGPVPLPDQPVFWAGFALYGEPE